MSYPFYTAADTTAQLIRIPGYDALDLPCPSDALACASMLIERLCELSFPPELCLRLAELSGMTGEADGFQLLAGALSGRFSLRLRVTDDIDRAISLLDEGTMAILRVPSPRDGVIRHILLCRQGDGYVYLLDPGYNRGKGIPRHHKRTMKQQGEFLLVPLDTFRQLYRSAGARCYLFSK